MENNNIKKRVITGLILTFVFSLVLAAMVFWFQREDYGDAIEDVYKMLCNAFFATGVIFAGFGLLLLIAMQGNFVGFQFMMKQAGQFLISPFIRHLKRLKYGEYKLEKEAEAAARNKDPRKWNSLIVGIVDLLISFIFLRLYYTI